MMMKTMTFETRKKLVVLILVVVSAWPLVHHGLMRGFDLNPWKWFGWSMYAVPPGRVRVFPYAQDGRPLGVTQMQRLAPDAQQRVRSAYQQFIRSCEGFGKNAEPDGFARALLEAYPEVDGVRLDVEWMGMTRGTGMYERQRFTSFEYGRVDSDP